MPTRERDAGETASAYATSLLSVDRIAEGTLGFRIGKPPGFEPLAGQYTVVHLPETDELRGEDREHMFSIASAPEEPILQFATRIEERDSPWKRTLANLAAGARLHLDEPDGQFVLPDPPEGSLAFLAGGIGITPLRALLRHLLFARAQADVALFYSNPTVSRAAFLQELRELPGQLQGFRLVHTVTDEEPPRGDERGRIDADMLARHLDDVHEPLYYLAGPPAMVKDMRRMLLSEDVGKERIKVESFTGY
ncbi:MAG TPA: FAD-dependent oxidoreductase [Candidatus Thermoplasmatota archaeon]|nr:FAD-dependent oxidoreductase [Candidatus Thermoplasmatota archaeon]